MHQNLFTAPKSRDIFLDLLATLSFYATASDLPGCEYSWPRAPSFIPYDVFSLHQAAPYSTSRYYELEKIYHPERPCNVHRFCRGFSANIRVKRYYVVVIAHEIHSEPNKRAAYDQIGTG